MNTRVGALMVAMAVVVAACGSSGSTLKDATAATTTAPTATTSQSPSTTKAASAATALPDPCTLVTKADAVQLAATDLDDGEKAGTPDNLSCTYVGPPTGPTAQLEFFVGDGAKKFLDIDRELGHDIVDLKGVGDEAYLEDFTLFFRTGQRWNVLRLTRLDDFAAYQQPMIDLAKKVVAKR
jgi:Protein of unknown function (DUF3558)